MLYDPDFYRYVRQYPDINLQNLLTKNHFNTLKKIKSSEELTSFLLSSFDGGDLRIIDHLTTPSPEKNIDALKHHFLKLIVLNLEPEGWDEIITSHSDNGINIIKYFIQNNNKPAWLFKLLISHLPNQDAVIDILRNTHFINEAPYALFIQVPIKTILEETQHFSDLKKMQLYLTYEAIGETDYSLAEIAESRGEMSLLIKSIKNKKIKKELPKIMEIIKLRNRSAHFLGLEDKKDSIFSSKYQINIEHEGLFDRISINYFRDTLKKYNNQLQENLFQPEFEKIQAAFDNIDLMLSPKAQVEKYRDYYNNNNFVIIPSGWPEHSITIAATDKYLIVANRGEGMDPLGGCIIYPLDAPLSKHDIKIFSEMTSQEAIQDHIKAIVKKDQTGEPIITQAFEANIQKYGTCGIANKKLIIKGLLPLLIELREDNSATPQFEKITLALSNEEYKQFTHFTRSSELNELFEALNTYPTFVEPIFDAFIQYCNQHPYLDKLSDAKLLHQIISRIPEEKMAFFLEQLSPDAKNSILFIKDHGSDTLPPHLSSPPPQKSTPTQTSTLQSSPNSSIQAPLNSDLSEQNLLHMDLKSRLLDAINQNDETKIKELINIGANIKQLNSIKEVNLSMIADYELAKELVNNGSIFPYPDKDGEPALLTAVKRGWFDIANKLLDNGADPSPSLKGGDTILMRSTTNFDFSKKLIEKGADIHAKNINGFTAFDLAIYNHQYDVAKLLLNEGARLVEENNGNIDLLLKVNSVSLVKRMIDEGFDLKCVDSSGSNFLFRANNPKLIKLLIDYGVDIHHRNLDNDFPIYIALYNNYLDIATILIQKANPKELLKDLRDHRVHEIINRLPEKQKENIIAELSKKISNEDMIKLRFSQGPINSKRINALRYSAQTAKENTVSKQPSTQPQDEWKKARKFK